MPKATKKITGCWMERLFLVALAVLMVLDMSDSGEFVAKTGLWYRKRALIYMLPVAVTLLFSLLRKPNHTTRNGGIQRAAFMICTILLGSVQFQSMTWGDLWTFSIAPMKPHHLLLAISITAIIFMMVWTLVWDVRRAALVSYWLLYACGYIYACVYHFRGIAFKPMDILTVHTALAVLDQYQLPRGSKTDFWFVCGICLYLISRWVPRKKQKNRTALISKVVCLATAYGWLAVLLFTPIVGTMGLETTTYEQDAQLCNTVQGTFPTLMREIYNLRKLNELPQGYDVQELMRMDQRLLQEEWAVPGEMRPNVLVIANESFADLSALWELELDRDPLSYLHSLGSNVVYGNLYVSSYGGGTTQTEHSFMTGTPLVPDFYIPMLTTITDDTPSLMWNMKSLGYTTYAIHPEKDTNYQRNKYYPMLGFDVFISGNAFENAEKIRGYTTDRATYETIRSLFEHKSPDEKLFVFDLTMQNHGGWGSDKMSDVVELRNPPQDELQKNTLQEYLTCTELADQALKDLIAYFERQEEPTVIVFFGDHQPRLDMSSFSIRGDLTSVEEKLIQQITPFVIWANYPIEAEYVEAISINYLSALLLEKAKLPMTAYDQWTLEAFEQYPVVLVSGYADASGRFFTWNEKEWPQLLRTMDQLRHNRLYDTQDRLPALGFMKPLH